MPGRRKTGLYVKFIIKILLSMLLLLRFVFFGDGLVGFSVGITISSCGPPALKIEMHLSMYAFSIFRFISYISNGPYGFSSNLSKNIRKKSERSNLAAMEQEKKRKNMI